MMELTHDEMKRACEVASQEVLRQSEQFKPDRPAIRDKKGWVCAQIFHGSEGNELVCSIMLQWNYTVAGSVGRICQTVHCKMQVIKKERGRFLHVLDMHLPELSKTNDEIYCMCCAVEYGHFNERHVIKADTSLEEF